MKAFGGTYGKKILQRNMIIFLLRLRKKLEEYFNIFCVRTGLL